MSSSLGKRDAQHEQTAASCVGVMALDRILAEPGNLSPGAAAAKRARVDAAERRSADAAPAQIAFHGNGGTLLPPIHFLAREAERGGGVLDRLGPGISGSIAGGISGSIAGDRISGSIAGVTAADPSVPRMHGGEPLMPLSLALWPRAGSGGPACLLPLPRLDRPAGPPGFPAAAAAASGSR
jgi:hypothetical protein